LLTRQWQTGEFKAEDAGSPILTSLKTTSSKITRYNIPEMTAPFHPVPTELPLEMLVEREDEKQIEWKKDENGDMQIVGYNGWRLRIQAGQQYVWELRNLLHSVYDDSDAAENKINEFLVVLKKPEYAGISSDILNDPALEKKTRDFLLPIVGLTNPADGCRSLDGQFFLKDDETDFNSAIAAANVTPPDREKAIDALSGLKVWFANFYSRPEDDTGRAWQSKRMEYEFSVSAPAIRDGLRGQKVLVSREYDGSDLDWFDFSQMKEGTGHLGDPSVLIDGEDELPISTEGPILSIPTVLSFYGCPNHRWWRFEDAKTDFGALTLDKVDLGKLLVMEFALIHGNDWFVIPLDMEIGDLKRIDELKVTTVFNEVFDIHPVRDSNNQIGWNQWDLFGMSIESDRSTREVNPCSSTHTDSYLFIPPTLGDKDENTQVEEVRYLKDEIANMVWGVEFTTINKWGESISGYETYRERLDRERVNLFKEAVAELEVSASDIALESEQLLIDEINAIVARTAFPLPDPLTVTGVLEAARAAGTDAGNEIVQLIEQSPLGILWSKVNTALQAAEDMSWMITNETISSYGSDVIENIIELPISEDFPDDLLNEIQEITLKARNYATKLSLKEFIDDPGPPLHYKLSSTVPENWIPYISVREREHGRQTSYFQGRVLRNDPIAPREPIYPRSKLLISTPQADEETVSRAGVKVNLGFQRTRWIDGSTHLWMGRSRTAGKGEGSSGLKFDYLETKGG